MALVATKCDFRLLIKMGSSMQAHGAAQVSGPLNDEDQAHLVAAHSCWSANPSTLPLAPEILNCVAHPEDDPTRALAKIGVSRT